MKKCIDESVNPWRRVSSKIAYENPWITVREDQVIRPDGQPGIYGVVESRIATGVLAFTEDNRLYLVGQYRYALERYSWEIIEGGAEHGEDPMKAAQRELREEAGLEARQWEPLGGDIHLSNCHSSECGRLYIARDLVEVGAEPEATEVLQIKCIPFSEALSQVLAGQITDSLSVIGILRAARMLQA